MGVLYNSDDKEKTLGCCRPPSKYSFIGSDGRWWSKLSKNSVWECDKCGKLFVARGYEDLEKWYVLRWYHIVALHKTKAERKNAIEQRR